MTSDGMPAAEGLVAAVRSRLAAAAAGAPAGGATSSARLPAARLTAGVWEEAAASGAVLGVTDLRAATARVGHHAWGLGPLQPLVEDPTVTDVLVNSTGAIGAGAGAAPVEVWVERGDGLARVAVDLAGEAEVRGLAVRLAASAGRRLDESLPWVDARLPGGVRLHAVLPPIAPHGTHLSLRLLRAAGLDLAGLQRLGTIPPAWLEVVVSVVRRRAAFLVTGGTGAGKTTLLAAMLSEVPAAERIVLVEDVGELQPRHPHLVRLEGRPANVEGRGEVTLTDLVRQALRMRPDRLVVGECRGAEVRDVLAALNTGHAGGCATLHANAPAEVPARLQALGALGGLGPAAVDLQASAGLELILHVARGPSGRRLAQLAVLDREPSSPGGRPPLTVSPALSADPAHPDDPGVAGPGWPRLARRLELPSIRWPP